MTAPPEFGAAIEVNGERPSWLPDDVVWQWTIGDGEWEDGISVSGYVEFGSFSLITAIRLEVPRYDLVYLALERGMVPWFGQSVDAPADFVGYGPGVWPEDGNEETVLYRCGKLGHPSPRMPHRWKHVNMGRTDYDIIGYTRKATTAALPLAHPAAPQGWDRTALIQAGMHESTNGASGDLIPYGVAIRALHDLRAALAPAAIASGREGAE